MTRRLLLTLAVTALIGCRSAAPPPATAPPSMGPQAPGAAVVEPLAIRWVRGAAEYRALVVQTYRAATAVVEREGSSRQPGTWAVVLDADETVISNLTYQVERAGLGQGFTPESWYAWVQRRAATPLPGAAAFLSRVRALGGHVAIVTNRRAAECDDTIAVFRQHALVYDVMLCRPDAGPSDKNGRFEAVARGEAVPDAGPLTIVAVLGDNIFDFPGLSQATVLRDDTALALFGTRYFVLPNPMYGSWER